MRGTGDGDPLIASGRRRHGCQSAPPRAPDRV